MIKITVDASKKYDCIIEKGALGKVGEYAKNLGLSGKACIISDSNVAPLYSEKVRASLENAGFFVCEYVFPAGEASKNADTFIDILEFLATNHFTRKDTLFALGGGVTGDLTGFSAATYMRGINFVQLPTSLLAAVDSSVGGKTAIDLQGGKNLAGAFYQPEIVVFDTDVLKSLPDEYFSDGMGEAIKYAMIADAGVEKLLGNTEENLEEIIAECIKIKRDIVNEDEFEGGVRRILNFGHTAGHAIEKLMNYTLSHGECVAIGMCIITRAWEKRGLCKEGTCDRLSAMCDAFGLLTYTDISAEKMLEVSKNDKKAETDGVNIVVPVKMGKCEVIKVSMDELLNIYKEGLE